MTLKIRVKLWGWAWDLVETKFKISSSWTPDDGDTIWCMHFTDPLDDLKEDKNMMIRHCFLEVLELFGILEYSRGYDGHYYDVIIKVKR